MKAGTWMISTRISHNTRSAAKKMIGSAMFLAENLNLHGSRQETLEESREPVKERRTVQNKWIPHSRGGLPLSGSRWASCSLLRSTNLTFPFCLRTVSVGRLHRFGAGLLGYGRSV